LLIVVILWGQAVGFCGKTFIFVSKLYKPTAEILAEEIQTINKNNK
jgi:hypothetical protein